MIAILLTASVGFAVPPSLVQSSNLGLNVKTNVAVIGLTAAPNRVDTSRINSNPDNWYWMTPDFAQSVHDDGQACPYDEGWSFRISFSTSDYSVVSCQRDSILHFTATSLDNRVTSGTWAGPADWTLNGVIDTRDFFEFLIDLYANNADFTLDGVTDSQDFFDFINWFFGPN